MIMNKYLELKMKQSKEFLDKIGSKVKEKDNETYIKTLFFDNVIIESEYRIIKCNQLMARFALRNQEKIKQTFVEERLNELLKALKQYSAKYPKQTLNEIIRDGSPYPTFVIDKVAVLYVTYLVYDVYHIALKEFL